MSTSSPSTHSWLYSETSFKASHNSYDRDERPLSFQLGWRAKPHQDGCRGLELDLHQSHDLWLWSVSHTGPYQGAADKQFGEYLIHLNAWSEQLSFALPALQAPLAWHRIIDTALTPPKEIVEEEHAVTVSKHSYSVAGRSVVLLLGK